MGKDKRYIQVKLLIIKGDIKSFNEIFDTLPKSVLARDMHMKIATLTKLMKRVDKIYLRDLAAIADLLELDIKDMIELVLEQYVRNKKRK